MFLFGPEYGYAFMVRDYFELLKIKQITMT